MRGLVQNYVYPVRCLGCCLLTFYDLPHNHHHPDLLPFHQESLLWGLQNLVDLQGDNILLPLPFGFSGSSTDTEIIFNVTTSHNTKDQNVVLKYSTNLGELTEVFINPPPWVAPAFHILNTFDSKVF